MMVKSCDRDDVDWTPVRYEKFDYDSLLGSHYGKYYLDCSNFLADVDDNEFKYFSLCHRTNSASESEAMCESQPNVHGPELRLSPLNLRCQKSSLLLPRQLSNKIIPMCEFKHGNYQPIDDMFHKFKRTHAKRMKQHQNIKWETSFIFN